MEENIELFSLTKMKKIVLENTIDLINTRYGEISFPTSNMSTLLDYIFSFNNIYATHFPAFVAPIYDPNNPKKESRFPLCVQTEAFYTIENFIRKIKEYGLKKHRKLLIEKTKKQELYSADTIYIYLHSIYKFTEPTNDYKIFVRYIPFDKGNRDFSYFFNK